MERLNAVWVEPASTRPELLVDRKEELEDFVGRLEEFRAMQKREGHLLVSGARGVGKSIFTKVAMRRFQEAHPEQVISIVVDGRGIRYRPFLNRFALQLSEATSPLAEKRGRKDLLLWLDQLALMANQSQITRAQTETVGRRYGAEAKLGADLFVKLGGRLSWEETRSLGTTVQTTLVVTDELLHAAISATLERLAQADSPWLIVVFFDDLDQAIIGDREEEAEAAVRQVLDLRPCISIVHFRTEALIENVKREVTEQLHLQPLPSEVLLEILHRRLEAAPEPVRSQFPPSTDWNAVQRLARLTGNPFTFLRWVHGLIRCHKRWPPPEEWLHPDELTRLVFTVDPLNGVDRDLARRLVRTVDRCDSGRHEVAVRREDLQRGCLEGDSGTRAEGISSEEIEDLVKLQVLLPRRRFESGAGYCIQPILALLRPSVRSQLERE